MENKATGGIIARRFLCCGDSSIIGREGNVFASLFVDESSGRYIGSDRGGSNSVETIEEESGANEGSMSNDDGEESDESGIGSEGRRVSIIGNDGRDNIS